MLNHPTVNESPLYPALLFAFFPPHNSPEEKKTGKKKAIWDHKIGQPWKFNALNEWSLNPNGKIAPSLLLPMLDLTVLTYSLL